MDTAPRHHDDGHLEGGTSGRAFDGYAERVVDVDAARGTGCSTPGDDHGAPRPGVAAARRVDTLAPV